MSHFLDRLTHFAQPRGAFADGHGETTTEDRTWEDAYRGRWQHDKIVRSTHGVNCTGSCSWKIYAKGGIVTWARSRPTTRAPARTCPTTSRAAADVVPRQAGICIRPIA
ncbi:hypothetical protein THIX_90443 [Thiomonas sp. X19]|nr:hypothetical protein THIX_90443 [Thiomonas sp. X19]